MANFPVYHGITLAEGSYVENLNVEILTADPVPVNAGRIWYNSTDKVFRQSTLNGSGAVIVRTFATVEELQAANAALEAAIAAEQTARVAGDATLAANLAAEQTARAAADATLQANVDAEAAARAAADVTLQGNIDAEAAARAAADVTLQGNIDAEAAARVAADATAAANLAAEVTARANADVTLQANIDAEAAARALEDTSIRAALAAEVTARSEGDATLTSAVAAEVTARTLADTTLQSNIDALSAQVTALGNAFNYVGGLNGGADVASALDMAAFTEGTKDSGDYYKVLTAGYFKVGTGEAFFANVGDGLVFNTFGGVDKIDNTDSNVTGTASEIAVTGSADTGFVVGIDSAFKTRVSNLESGLTSEQNARTAADATLQANIDAEAAARGAADATLTAAVAAEVTARTLADSTLQANIDAEAAARSAADSTLQANIDAEAAARAAADVTAAAALAAEVTARQAADATINAAIGDVGTLSTTATTVVGAINEINAQVAGGTEAVRDAYDATVWTYESTSAGTTHVLAHNLGSAFVDFSVMIQRADGFWYNDIASIQIDSVDPTNKATLYLSTALNVRVIARSAAKLGLVA